MFGDVNLEITTTSEADTQHLAATLAPLAEVGDIIALSGDLGTGKTVFARAFINTLGESREVPSPTFTLVQSYYLNPTTVHHFDLYRLEKSEDAFELGIEELFVGGISLIEWPERLGSFLPMDRLNLIFSYSTHLSGTTTTRQIKINGPRSWQSRINNAFQKQKHD